MKPIRMCLAALRGERGDADPIAVLAGAAMFLVASVGLGGVMTMTLAASARAQSNTELTQAVESELSSWKTDTLYRDIVAIGPTPEKITVKSSAGAQGTREVTIWKQVTKLPSIAGTGTSGAWQTTIAAPRGAFSTTPVNCKPALTAPVEQCLTLTSTVSPAGIDRLPIAPAGLIVKPESAPQGVTLAKLELSEVVDADGYADLRVAVLPSARTPIEDGMWNVSFVCTDTGTLAPTTGTRFVKAAKDSAWLTGRVTIHSSNTASNSSCPSPRLLLWAKAGVTKPTVQSLTYVDGVVQVTTSKVFGDR